MTPEKLGSSAIDSPRLRRVLTDDVGLLSYSAEVSMSAIEVEVEPELKVPGDGGEMRLTLEQRRNLCDPKIQEQYRREYSIQQARRSCPGCGESSLSF